MWTQKGFPAKRFGFGLILGLGVLCFLWISNGCSQNSPAAPSHGFNSINGGSGSSATCTLTENTTATGAVNGGCTMISLNATGCQSTRQALGLSGAWLQFACTVGMSVTTIGGAQFVQLTTSDQPDYESNYFSSTSACYLAYSPTFPDPNSIETQSVTMFIPLNPNTASQSMNLGAVGMALNGVLIYDNQAAPGDDIYSEAGSFDPCQGHPDPAGKYHYHAEPYALSYDDNHLIGVMRDGYFVYGRLDMNGNVPTLDSNGGVSSPTAYSNGVPVYHYNTNKQTSTNSGTAGQSIWFLTTGSYKGTPGSCSGC